MIKAYSVRVRGYARCAEYRPWDIHLTERYSIREFSTRKAAKKYARTLTRYCVPWGKFKPISFKVYSYKVDDDYFKDDLSF